MPTGWLTDAFTGNESQNSASQPPPSDIQALWQKASQSPSSLTSEERLKILERWPKEDADSICREKTSLTLDEIIAKAISHPDQLFLDECRIITSGPFDRKPGDWNFPDNILSWPKEVRAMRSEARTAAQTQRHLEARKNAEEAERRWTEEERAATKKLGHEDILNIRWANKIDWASTYHGREWGLVLLRTDFGDEESWSGFKEQLLDCTQTALAIVKNSGRMRRNWRIEWIEDRSLEGAALSRLCQRFHELRTSAACKDLRQDVFLYADGECLRSSKAQSPLPQRGYVKAVDASFTEGKRDSYLHGFQGELKVALTHALTSFFGRLIPRDDPEDDPTNTRGLRQSWDVMYYKARYDVEGRVYPPKSALNR